MKFQVLAILYGFSRECLAIEADTSLSGYRVVGVLERLAEIRGPPEAILHISLTPSEAYKVYPTLYNGRVPPKIFLACIMMR